MTFVESRTHARVRPYDCTVVIGRQRKFNFRDAGLPQSYADLYTAGISAAAQFGAKVKPAEDVAPIREQRALRAGWQGLVLPTAGRCELSGPTSSEVRAVAAGKMHSRENARNTAKNSNKLRALRLFSHPRAATYVRRRDLPGLMPMWPAEIEDTSETGRAHIVERLRNALRAERRRGLAGHWTYDLGRHAGMLRALSKEAEELAALRRSRRRCGP